jgi:3-oxoadipate enol-lactonase
MTSSSFQTADGCRISYTLRAPDTLRRADTLCPDDTLRQADTLRPAGAPKRIVLIHSLALDRGIWDGVAEKLADRAAVLAYDTRGHGRSSRVPGPFSMEQFAHDLAELMDHVEWPAAVIAGCSLGGCVAQAFGGLNPERAAGLGLIDTTAWYGADGPAEWRQRASKAKANGLAALVDFQTTRWFGDRFRVERPDLVDAAVRVFLANDLECYRASCEMLGDADLRPYLPAFRMPVAVVVGDEDQATPLAAAQELHQAIGNSTLTVLKGRHLTPIECPDEIARILLTLLGPGRDEAAP